MVHPQWESVISLVNRYLIDESGEDKYRDCRFDPYYMNQDIKFSSRKKVNGMVKAIRWAINGRIFTETHPFLYTVMTYVKDIQKRMNRQLVHDLNVNHNRAALRGAQMTIQKKKGFCEETILDEIWDYSVKKNKPTSNFIPKIGIELEVENGRHRDPHPDWENKSDGSLCNGREYVSQPVHLDEGMAQFRQVVGKVKEWGGVGDTSCGLHFHIGTDPNERPSNPWKDEDLLEKQNAILDFINTHRGNPDFRYVFPENRYHNSYCKPIPSDRSCRYHAVNFHSMSEHGTVEIRFCAVPEDLNEEWIDQFEKVVRYCYSIVSGDSEPKNPVPYEGPITFSFQEKWVDSEAFANYWSNFSEQLALL